MQLKTNESINDLTFNLYMPKQTTYWYRTMFVLC